MKEEKAAAYLPPKIDAGEEIRVELDKLFLCETRSE